jgi:plastocyanin
MKTLFAAAIVSATMFAQAPAPAAAPAKPARIQPPARILEFKAQQASVQAGQPVLLIWATENPNSTTITPQPGRVTPRGSQAVTPTATTTYTLTVTGPNNQMESQTVTINVTGSATATASAAVGRHPDMSGVYAAGGGGGGRGAAAPAGPELKPGKENFRVVRGPNDAGYLSDCMPVAGPAAYGVPYPFQIIQSDKYFVIFHEYPGTFRIVPMDGGVHTVDPDPTWLGESIGKWEGDTFVIDAIGFNTRTELNSYKHSESLHIVEKFRKPAPETLEYEATIEDPEVFVRPYVVTRTFSLRPDLKRIDEFVCENNKDYKELFVTPAK